MHSRIILDGEQFKAKPQGPCSGTLSKTRSSAFSRNTILFTVYHFISIYLIFLRKTKASGLHCAQCWSGEANFYTSWHGVMRKCVCPLEIKAQCSYFSIFEAQTLLSFCALYESRPRMPGPKGTGYTLYAIHVYLIRYMLPLEWPDGHEAPVDLVTLTRRTRGDSSGIWCFKVLGAIFSFSSIVCVYIILYTRQYIYIFIYISYKHTFFNLISEFESLEHNWAVTNSEEETPTKWYLQWIPRFAKEKSGRTFPKAHQNGLALGLDHSTNEMYQGE